MGVARYRWQIETIDAGPEPSSRIVAARLLLQATWGPTRTDITHLASDLGGNATAWVEEQMALPATLHRAYFRARSNPEYPQGTAGRVTATLPAGGLFHACGEGARWSRFAISIEDVGRVVTTAAGTSANTTVLSINGFFRTVVDDTVLTSTVGTISGPFLICYVGDEVVGGDVNVTTSST